MSEQMEQNNRLPGEAHINYDEPPTKPPPLLEVGAIAWVRNNLFSTPFDIILTILGAAFILSVLVSMLSWVIQDGNWFAVSFNFRQFMVGRFDRAEETRLVIMLLFIMFVVGALVAAYLRRIVTALMAIIAIVVIPIFAIPIVTQALIPLPEVNLTAGNIPIVRGTEQELPIPELAFIAAAGETIEVALADIPEGLVEAEPDPDATAAPDEDEEPAEDTGDEETAEEDIVFEVSLGEEYLYDLSGFGDRASNSLRNAARVRLDDIESKRELEETISEDAQLQEQTGGFAGTLTDNQRSTLARQLGRLNIPEEPVPDTYNLNNVPVSITILDSALEPVGETIILEPDSDTVATVSIPEDGWYIIQKEIASEEESVALLRVRGIYPIFDRTPAFERMTDDFIFVGEVPENTGGDEIPFNNIIQNQYRGARDFGTYVRVYLAPFFSRHSINVLIAVIAAVLGYLAGVFLDNNFRQREARVNPSEQLATWLIVVAPVIIFLLVNGMHLLSIALIVSWLAWVMGVYYAGRRFGGMLDGVAVFAAALVVWVIGAVVYSLAPDLLFGQGTMLPIFAGLLMLPGGIAFWYGTTNHDPHTEAADLRKLVISAGVMLAFFVIPVLLSGSEGLMAEDSILNILTPTDPARWGGLLLALMVTVYGISFAFPLGIVLALGRKSEDLPVIQVLCTMVIEFVRGTPFIVVLFAGQLLVPLIHPSMADIPNVYRALAATIIFSAAYLAENVRGGLQSIPPGQAEAARAVGLSGWQVVVFILMPQALRAVIPALVGQFIGLFKDTSLLAIVGLIDLTGVVNSMVVQAEFIGTRREGLLFISIIYFVISYIMSWVSRRIEESGSGAARRF